MSVIYTHTTWYVIAGKEAEFEKRWADWADWGHQAGLVKGAKLLKSNDEEGVFVSFGIWKDLSQAKAWRKAAGYAERLGKLQQVITKFEPRTLQQVGEA
ncbi:MAG: antibiotic biosynthesis monooxygenase [Spirochaetales bacterium]